MFEERPTIENLMHDLQQLIWKLETEILENDGEKQLDIAQRLVKQAQQLEHQIWFKNKKENAWE